MAYHAMRLAVVIPLMNVRDAMPLSSTVAIVPIVSNNTYPHPPSYSFFLLLTHLLTHSFFYTLLLYLSYQRTSRASRTTTTTPTPDYNPTRTPEFVDLLKCGAEFPDQKLPEAREHTYTFFIVYYIYTIYCIYNFYTVYYIYTIYCIYNFYTVCCIYTIYCIYNFYYSYTIYCSYNFIY